MELPETDSLATRIGLSGVIWKGFRDTFLWMVVLLLLTVIIAGGVAARWWASKDDLITEIVREQLTLIFPECHVKFEAARLVDLSQIEIQQLTLIAKKTDSTLLQVPRTLIQIDTQMMQRNQRVVIREIVVHQPELYFVRDRDHRWNWQDLVLLPPKSSVSPEWTIKGAAVRVGFESSEDLQTRYVHIQGIQANFKPESNQRYGFEGIGNAEVLGQITLSGLIDNTVGEWRIEGSAGNVRLGDSLLDLAARFSPKVQQQLSVLRETNQALLSQFSQTGPERTASLNGSNNGSNASNHAEETDTHSVGMLRADMAVQFRLEQANPNSLVDYLVSGRISHGQISEALLPVPLYDVDGAFRLTRDEIEIQELRAANGPTTLFVDGTLTRDGSEWSKQFLVRATKLGLDERIQKFLWGQPAKLFEMLKPSGTFDIGVSLSQAPGQKLEWTLENFEVIQSRVLCDYFRYPIEQVRGTVRQEGQKFLLDLSGEASGELVRFTGFVDPTTVHPEMAFEIQLKEFPLDSAVRNALQREDQQKIRQVLDSLRITGMANDVVVKITRTHETKHHFKIGIAGTLHDGTLNYVGFPYELTQLNGKLTYDPLLRDAWLFENLTARHGTAELSGQGYFDAETEEHEFFLELNALNTPLDNDLQKATITANSHMQDVWNDFGLKGRVDIDRIEVRWMPGAPVNLELSKIHWTQGELLPKVLPYLWKNVTGVLGWKDNRLTIHSLQGDHNGTHLLVDGTKPNSAFLEIFPDQPIDWRIYFNDQTVNVRRVVPDDELKRAIPTSLSDAINSVQFQNAVDLRMGFAIQGKSTDPASTTATWIAYVDLKENSFNAGTTLSNLSGTVVQRGTWRNNAIEIEGFAQLKSLRVLNLNFERIEGPFMLKENRLTLGSPQLTGKPPVYSENQPFRHDSMRGTIYGGIVAVDIELRLSGNQSYLPYWLEFNVYDVQLGQWAREHGFQKMAGTITAVVQLEGTGQNVRSQTGRGWIQITPAALYELPLFAQILTTLSFKPTQQGEAAFTNAYAHFTIQQGTFQFNEINLIGEKLKLGGQGTVVYDGPDAGSLRLDFYTKATRILPILGGWIYVKVEGTTSQQNVEIAPRIPLLDNQFADFMQAVDSGQQRLQPIPLRRLNPLPSSKL